MILYGNTLDDAGKTARYGSVEWAEGYANWFLTGFGHIELSKSEAERLVGDLSELLANW